MKFETYEWKKHGMCSNMNQLNFFKFALDIFARNDLQKILKDANILHGGTYDKSEIITTINTSFIGVEPERKCEAGDLVEIRICLVKISFPNDIKCPS